MNKKPTQLHTLKRLGIVSAYALISLDASALPSCIGGPATRKNTACAANTAPCYSKAF